MARSNESVVLDETFVSIAQTAKLLSISQTTVRRLVADGELTVLRIPGSCPKIRKADVTALVGRALVPARAGV